METLMKRCTWMFHLDLPSRGNNKSVNWKKSLDALKQASWQWFSKFSNTLIDPSFIQSKSDYNLFMRTKGNVFIALLVYVDDVILASNDSTTIAQFITSLNQQFKLKDLGTLKFFLSLEVARSTKGISLSQRKYALDIFEDSSLLAAKPSKFSMEKNIKLSKDNGSLLEDSTSYMHLIFRLIYLTITRPDLAYVAQNLSQFMDKLRQPHLEVAHKVLRYLKNSPGQGIFFPSSSNFWVKTFCDADWAGCSDTRRLITSFCVFLEDTLISWKSKKR